MTATPILFVNHARALGGAEVSLRLLFELLDRQRFAPHLATRPGALAEAARALSVPVHEVPLDRLRGVPSAPWRLARGAAALAQTVREQRIALIHASTIRASAYAATAARLARRRLVWHVHDILPRTLYIRALGATCDAAIAVSKAVAAPLGCAHKVRVIPNGVRLADYSVDRRDAAARLRTMWGVPADAVLVGQVARLQPWKGQRDVIAVADAVLREAPQTYFVIVGGDIFADAAAYEHELRAHITARNLTQRVIFAGHHADVAPVLSALDVLVHASHDEPFGRILIEAGAAGLPVVAYGGGGVAEIIQHQRTGLIVPAGDRAALASALCQLQADPALRMALGAAARIDVAQRFDAQRITAQIEQVLQSVLT